MKSELIQPVTEERTYPYLGICNGGIVLFNAPKTGIVIKISCQAAFSHKLGEYRTDWPEQTLFTSLRHDSKVILSND